MGVKLNESYNTQLPVQYNFPKCVGSLAVTSSSTFSKNFTEWVGKKQHVGGRIKIISNPHVNKLFPVLNFIRT